MRTTALHTISLMAALAATACSAPAPPPYGSDPRGTVSVAFLKSLCDAGSVTVTDDIAVTGRVVANDLYGEYSKTIVLCDDSGGIEIAVDSDNTAAEFPVSARVTVHCTSLALGDYGGRVMLGAQPSGEYAVDRIAEADFDRFFSVDVSSPQAAVPQAVTIRDIGESHISGYVELRDVTFGADAGLAWCDTDPETGRSIDTRRTAADRSGAAMTVRTIAGCEYAGETIPSGYGTLRGIAEYFNGEYSLRITNHQILFPDRRE